MLSVLKIDTTITKDQLNLLVSIIKNFPNLWKLFIKKCDFKTLDVEIPPHKIDNLKLETYDQSSHLLAMELVA